MTTWYKGMSEGLVIDKEPSLQTQVQLAVSTGSSTGGTCSSVVALLRRGLPVVMAVHVTAPRVDPGFPGHRVASGI